MGRLEAIPPLRINNRKRLTLDEGRIARARSMGSFLWLDFRFLMKGAPVFSAKGNNFCRVSSSLFTDFDFFLTLRVSIRIRLW